MESSNVGGKGEGKREKRRGKEKGKGNRGKLLIHRKKERTNTGKENGENY